MYRPHEPGLNDDLVLPKSLHKDLLFQLDCLRLTTCEGGKESIDSLKEKLQNLRTVEGHVSYHREQVRLDTFD